MTELTTLREYKAKGGNVHLHLGLEFVDDAPTRHILEVEFGKGTPYFKHEIQEFPGDLKGSATATNKFNAYVRSFL